MRIGFDLRMGGSMHAGIGRYSFALLIAMLKRDRDNEFIVFYKPDAIADEDLIALQKFSQVTLVSTNARHYSFSEQLIFLRQLNKAKLDIVHFPNFNVPIWYNRPYVVTIHDVVHHKISGHKIGRYWKFMAYKKIIETAAKKAIRIITVSEASKKDIAKTLKVSLDKIDVVYEGTTLEPVSDKQIADVKRSYLLSRPYFLFVGTLERKKNVVQLTHGFDEFLSKYNLDMDLVIAGKPDPHYPEIKFQAMDVIHKNRLVFTDYISDTDLSALYQGAYAYANASLHEGFGLPGVEAMRFGLPLAVSNIEVFNEVYDNAALYFDPYNLEDMAEKFYLLAKDTQFHQQMQQKSLVRSQYFDWDIAAKQTLEIYRQTAKELKPVEPQPETYEPEPEDDQ
ncbi:MAG: glycosyltransferase family 4 protein [Candidatus Doudnabacteria bacterium]|nr:glycosyltransferase family 4 protein [Candidatus Doudnabacteria bacterium]